MTGAAFAAGLAALAFPAAAAPPAADLTTAQLAGQRVVFAWRGRTPPRNLVKRVERGEAAGVILFAQNVGPGLRKELTKLQRAAKRSPVRLPLLVMVDQEGGPVLRLPGGPRRSAAEVGRDGRRATAQADGRRAARALRAVGANIDLAPVVDVCRPGSAMERERRCYGRRSRKVIRLAGGFAAGLRSRGVLPALKHYPGFGAAGVNTDNAATDIDVSRRTLRRVDERPYREIDAQVVMLSTAVYPALSPRPAALSHAVATKELRGRTGFTGVSITDALGTPAVARYGGYGGRAVEAVRAGTDIALFGGGYGPGSLAARTLTKRLREGRLSRRAFERSAARVLRLRELLAEEGD